MDIKNIRKLVKLYFDYNPNMNRGIGFRSKAFDIISSYVNIHNMTYEDVVDCIESQPMCRKPIWDMFYDYWFKKQNNKDINKEEKKSSYKNSINDSTDVDDWL